MNRRIQKLEIKKNSPVDFDQLEKFCRAFSNLEQLTCITDNEDFMFYLIKHLPRLILLILQPLKERYRYKLSWLEDEVKTFEEAVFINSVDGMKIYLFR